MEHGAIVLAGGRSTRMGTPKALLDWHGVPLVAHLAAVASRAVDGGPVVVVRAPGQELPALPVGVGIADDEIVGRGPLQGLLAGLRSLTGRAAVAFVTGTDTPFLHPGFVGRVLAAVEPDVDAAVPTVHEHRHPLLAAYRTSLAPLVAELLAGERLRPAFVFERCRVRWLEAPDLSVAGDPDLRSVENVNTPDEYETACAVPLPRVEVVTYGVARLRSESARTTVEALRLGQAAAAVGIELDGHVVAAVNGAQIVADPLYPLAAGDEVSLFGADAGG
jgi:molybdopterin-guanine dinucleotide biosynthesis protein A